MSRKINVLFLRKWYPCRNRPLSGVFIKRHGVALTNYCQVLVLYAIGDDNLQRKWLDFQFSSEEGLETLRVYYRKKITYINFFDKVLRLVLYVIAQFRGYQMLIRKYGKPDLVHVHVLLRPVLLAWYLKLKYNINYIIAEHWTGYLPSDGTYQRQSFFRKWLCRIAVAKCKHVTPDSTDLGIWMQRHGFRSQFTTIRNVVDTSVFKYYYSEEKKERKRIIHVSSLNDQQKNVSGIIDAIKQVAKQREDFELYLVGSGYDEQKLIELTLKLNLLEKVIFFVGRKDNEELAKLISSGDFLILFSNYENQPCVIGEALSCQIPVLATSVGDIPNIISADLGKIVEPGNVEKLVQEVNYMIDYSSHYDKKYLREYAIQNYSKEIVGKKLFEVYSAVLS